MCILECKGVEGIIVFLPVLSLTVLPFDHIDPGLLVPTLYETILHDDGDKGYGQDKDIQKSSESGTQEILDG